MAALARELARLELSMQPPLTEEDLRAVDVAYGLQLPDAYRAFVTACGNGVFTADGRWVVLPLGVTFSVARNTLVSWHAAEIGDLSAPLPIGADSHGDGAFEWSSSHGPPPGAFPVAYDGDGVFTYLVTAGPERGNAWQREGGRFRPLRPPAHARPHARLDFLDWVARRLERL